MNSSMACPYDSCELAAASEFRTAFFDCSKSGSRSIVLALERLLAFFRCPILAASRAAISMVVHKDPNPVSGLRNEAPKNPGLLSHRRQLAKGSADAAVASAMAILQQRFGGH